MANDPITRLPNPPLREAIFEVRWKLNKGPSDEEFDPGFRLFLGRFYERMRTKLPVFKDLPTAQVPEAIAPRIVRHQFWTADATWPVVQAGPGILTVNHNASYDWLSFRPYAVEILNAFIDSYPQDVHKLEFSSFELKYLNQIFHPDIDADLGRFLRDYLHINTSLDEQLFLPGDHNPSPFSIHFHVQHQNKQLPGMTSVRIANFRETGSHSVILEIMVQSRQSDAVVASQNLPEWLDRAHYTTHHWFCTICKDKMMQVFRGNA